MTVEQHTPTVVRLDADALSEAEQEAALHGAGFAPADVAVVKMSGPAVVDCLQGLLTNDVAAPGNEGFVYGAVLTTKGMIVCDLWVARDGNDAWVFAPAHGLDALLDVFKRFVPPRLATYEHLSDHTVIRLVGADVARRVGDAGIAVPQAGRATRATLESIAYHVAHPGPGHGFRLQLWCAMDAVTRVSGALRAAGVERLPPDALELVRIVAGAPRLGTEIDAKTLPQEARFEELHGVSYSKGCYTGQETVARVHFRGHPNRWLGGLLWDEAPDSGDPAVTRDGKTVGRVTSVAWLHDEQRWIGLGLLRREVETGQQVTAGGRVSRVRPLPHALPE